jgi:prepilin-type N-terminal cleavage/methylation domain-containing protein
MSEEGYTLPELLIALAIGLLVAFGATSMVMMAVKAEPRTSQKAGQLQQGRAMSERLVRELRQGEEVIAPWSASELELLTMVHATSCGGTGGSSSILCRVEYKCEAGTCTRAERNPDGSGSGPAEELVSGLASSNVFEYESSEEGQPPNYVSVRLEFPSELGGESVTVADGAGLRNWAPALELEE